MLLLEGIDPDIVAGRDGDWKGWIQTLLLEGTSIGRLDPDVVTGRDRSRRCCWKGIGKDVNWKGWIRTLLLEGDWKGWIRIGIGRDIDWKGWIRTLLVAPIDIVVDCSNQCCCC